MHATNTDKSRRTNLAKTLIFHKYPVICTGVTSWQKQRKRRDAMTVEAILFY